MAMAWRGTAARGFTLLEMLIAIAILGIMMAVLFSCFAASSRSWNTGEKHLQKVEQMAMVQGFFRKHLAAAWNQADLPGEGQGESGTTDTLDKQKVEQEAFFQGDEQSLQFVSLLPASAARGGWHLFKVGLKPGTAALYVTTTPYLPFYKGVPQEPEAIEILPGLETLAIAYWGKKPDDDAPQWHREWANIPALPELVSINLTLRGQKPWPTLVVAPRRAPPLSKATSQTNAKNQ